MADFLIALADFDRRRGWEPLGHASLFAFLNVELGLSKGAAFVRSTAARLILAHPEALAPLRDGRLCLSSVAELGRVATLASFAEVLPRFFGCSSREAREVAAAIAPREAPPHRDQVTRLAPVERRALFISFGTAMAPGSPPASGTARSLHPSPADVAAVPTPAAQVVPTPASVAGALMPMPVDSESVRAHELDLTHPGRVHPRCDQVEPLTADLRRLHVTVSCQLLKKLGAARDGLSHAIPGATTDQVIEAALDLLLERQARARGLVKRPRSAATVPVEGVSLPSKPTQPAPGPAVASGNATEDPCASQAEPEEGPEPFHRRAGPREAIPAAVRRAVWERDGGRCAWPLDGGGCCGSTYRLQLDHVVPWARGGEGTAANIRLTCAAHNGQAARQAFGKRWMGRYAGGG